MTMQIDDTHNPGLKSWVKSASAPHSDFPIQNLPVGCFQGSDGPHLCMAIGDYVLDLNAAHRSGLFDEMPAEILQSGTIDALLSRGSEASSTLRLRAVSLLNDTAESRLRERVANCLRPQAECRMMLPSSVRSFTDFYAGIYHAKAAGKLLQPDNPLPKNYKWVPIAYDGRAASVQVSGTNVRRPKGQRPPGAEGAEPVFAPSQRLDFELELGFYIRQQSRQGIPIPITAAADHIGGFCLLNDWSARDIQAWEMFPLGPFLGKSFATSVSPWVVLPEALAPFRVPAMTREPDDPQPLAYLRDETDQSTGGLDIVLSVTLLTDKMRAEGQHPEQIITSNGRHLYWTFAQMVAHHSSNGCRLNAGDLVGTGTISGPKDEELSSLLELAEGGQRPIRLANGEVRTFLQDGDEIAFHGRCERDGFVGIGFGPCVGRILPSLEGIDA